MTGLLTFALLLAAAQQDVPVPADQPQNATETVAAEPEKICKRKIIATGEGTIGSTKSIKVCKTREEWARSKSRGR